MKIIIASHNQGKVNEFKKVIKDFEVMSLADLNVVDDIEETGRTYNENAVIKASAVSAMFPDAIVVGEDSGIEFACLNDLPGLYSARFLSNMSSDERNQHIIDFAQTTNKLSARYKGNVVIYRNNELVTKFETYTSGSVAPEMKGDNGFSYDSIFVSDETNGRTWGEITDEEKNAISHRGKAAYLINDYLVQYMLGLKLDENKDLISFLREMIKFKPYSFSLRFGYYSEYIKLTYVDEETLQVDTTLETWDSYADHTNEFSEIITYEVLADYFENRLSEEVEAYMSTPAHQDIISLNSLLQEVCSSLQYVRYQEHKARIIDESAALFRSLVDEAQASGLELDDYSSIANMSDKSLRQITDSEERNAALALKKGVERERKFYHERGTKESVAILNYVQNALDEMIEAL